MACCAFAVFLLTQLLAPFRAARARLGFAPPLRPDAAVLWTPGAAVAAPVAAPRRWARAIVLVVALDLAGLAFFRISGVAADMPRLAAPGGRAAALEDLIHASICGQNKRRP